MSCTYWLEECSSTRLKRSDLTAMRSPSSARTPSTCGDALDVLRLLRGTTTDDLAGRMHRLLDDYNARPVAEEALELLGAQFANRAGEGIRMAVRAVGVLDNPAEIAASCEVLAGDVLTKMSR